MQIRQHPFGRTARSLWSGACLMLGLGFGGCATHDQSLSNLPVQEFTGYYTSAQGQSWFRASNASPESRPLWVTFTGHAVAEVEKARAAGQFLPGQRYLVRWKAAVTTGGEVGPQGHGSPALLVRELLNFSPAPATDGAK